ncbi:hypothetical protein Acr_04g0010270 [Actinidia rufa]|uniref:Flavin-containing monooxygenase n=1 Tax=Actinidia rufa TaxID=165716 RepID=A0A7J0EK21_9ERIC|nr:hypothetical protein Acr_04g0010270 [Actinidia rufa]
MEKKRIAVIGAGISGLLACKHTLEKGFSPIVFEARPTIGGVWAQTIESTRLQTPKDYYRFSDFEWPGSVRETFPDHNQVVDYIRSYAVHFNILPLIKFNSRVIGIDYCWPSDQEEGMDSWDLWGGTGWPFSPKGKWNVTVQDARDHSAPPEVYEVDFVILCIGKFSDLPNIPDFPPEKGPEVFKGKVIHSMDYAAMADDQAAAFIKGKRTVVVGFQKSGVDVAAEVATRNGQGRAVRTGLAQLDLFPTMLHAMPGPMYPCTLLFRTVHWTVPERLHALFFRNLNRFSELMIHKPGEGLFSWLLALLLSPLLWIFSKLVENYLKWIYPLKKYNMIPGHGFFRQISSCMFTVLSTKFYETVEEGSLILHQSQKFSFCEKGLNVDTEDTPLEADIVIFATGYRSDEKLKNIFTSTYFQNSVAGSSAPFYR